MKQLLSLDLKALRVSNVERDAEVFGHLNKWSATDYACAVGGECGEALNVVKKLHRGDFQGREKEAKKLIGEELADLLIYADLLAAKLDIDLAGAVIDKFNASSIKYGSIVRIGMPAYEANTPLCNKNDTVVSKG